MQSSVDAVKPGSSSSGIRQTVQAFPPVYFAMVMATGIVSIAVYLNGMQRLAATLMWLNVVPRIRLAFEGDEVYATGVQVV